MAASGTVRGRLAPSPTGYAHLGNAWSFLMAWLSTRSKGGEIVFRMEDLDLERSSVVHMQALMLDMRWMGLDWDEGPTPERIAPMHHQSNRYGIYRDALEALGEKGLAYPCFCSRKDVRGLASAPHIGDTGAAYPGTCRDLAPEEVAERMRRGLHASWRFRSPEKSYSFTDVVYGPQTSTLEECGGDFNLCRSDGVFSYQLAVSVDDALMGVNEVVRGRDILPSTPRQVALHEALGHPVPTYGHIPLLLDGEGERLAKRHASLSLGQMRDEGVSPWRIVGLLGRIAGLLDRNEEARPQELVSLFHLDRMPREDYTLTPQDMAWLTGKEKAHG